MFTRTTAIVVLVTSSLALGLPPELAAASTGATSSALVPYVPSEGVERAARPISAAELDGIAEDWGVGTDVGQGCGSRSAPPERDCALARAIVREPIAVTLAQGTALVEHFGAEHAKLASGLRALRQRYVAELATARAARGSVDPSAPKAVYRATDEEIAAVETLLAESSIRISTAEIQRYSRSWQTRQGAAIRAVEVVTLAVLALAAVVGAIHSVVVYYIDYRLYGGDFTCMGIAKAIVTGAVMGMMDLPEGVIEVLASLIDPNELVSLIAPLFESYFKFPFGPQLYALATAIPTLLDVIDTIIQEIIWADPSVRAVSLLICKAISSEVLWTGGLAGVKTFVQDEFVPALMDEWGNTFSNFGSAVSDAAKGRHLDPDAQPRAFGSLETTSSSGRDTPVLSPADTLNWRIRFQPNQPGSYRVRLKVFHSGTDYGQVVETNTSADYENQELDLAGTLNAASISSLTGEGSDEFRIEVTNLTRGWTAWLQKKDGSADAWPFEIRSNRKPSVTLTCATLLGLSKCDLFVADSDGTRPTALYLNIDGTDQNLTSQLPTSGVNWADGYTVTQNLSLAQGIHAAQARVSDALVTYTADAQTLRVGSLPYPDFPAVTLTDVGAAHQYAVRWHDSIGGIPGADVYVHTANAGYILDSAGNPLPKVTTDSNGWAYFYYKPLATGQHTLTISVNGYDLSQTSNSVGAAGPTVPAAPTGLAATAQSSTKVQLNWTDNADNEDGYEIERKTGSGGSWGLIGSVGWNGTSYSDLVSPNTAYYYRVRAHNAAGYSSYSNEAPVTSCVAPDALQIDEPYNGQTSVPITTTLAWFTTNGVSTYDIYLGTANPPTGPPYASVTADPGMPDTQSVAATLTAGTLYYWQVKAHAACNTANVSSSPVYSFATLGTPGTVTLVKPTNAQTGVPNGVVFEWQPVTTPGTTIYDLYYGTTDPPPFVINTSWMTQFLATNLTANTPYYWKVVAKAAADPTLQSTSLTWHFTTGSGAATTTNFPAIKDAMLRGAGYANVNYGIENTGSAADGLMACGNSKNLFLVPASAPVRAVAQYDLSSIPAGSQIYNATLNLPWAGGEYASGPNRPLELDIDPLAASWGETTITWTNRPALSTANRVVGSLPASTGSPLQNDATPLVQKWANGTLANNGIQVSLPAWEPIFGDAFYFEQREYATDSASYLTITYGPPCTAPAAATTPSPASGAAGQLSTVNLSWAPVTGASSYKVYLGTTNPPTTFTPTSMPSLTVNGLLGNTPYYWYVVALADCDTAHTSTSATWSFTTGSCIASPLPSQTSPADNATAQPHSVTLTWSSVPWASSYQVLVGSANPPATVAATVTGTSFVLPATPETTTFWMVRAIATCNPSLTGDSPVRAFTTGAAPKASAGSPKTMVAGSSTSIGGAPSASGGTPPYTYAWSVVSGRTASITPPAGANPTFSSCTAGDATSQLVVTDSVGFSSSPATVLVTVTPESSVPAVTPPASIAVNQTTCCGVVGGATPASSAALDTFVGAGSATDSCTASLTRLPAQAGGTDVTSMTCFPAGTTPVTFRFQDGSDNIGSAVANVTVRMFGDLNADAAIDPSDMVVLRAYFNFVVSPGTPPFSAPLGSADLNHDSTVDPSDLVILRAYFNFVVSCLAP